MVLRSWSLLLVAGCVTAGGGQVELVEPTPIVLALVELDSEARASRVAPDAMRRHVVAQLRARALVASPEDEGLHSGLAMARDTRTRLAALARESEAPHLLLVEAEAFFYSQLSGRYRWTVSVRLTLATRGALDRAVRRDFELPVFLSFDHQREAAALSAAAPQIAARVGGLCDEYFAPGAAATPAQGRVRGDLIYFVLVDRFENGDPKNDRGVDLADPAAWHGGDLQGVIDRLDWLEDLGVGTVWLSPLYRSRSRKLGDHAAFHGYWVWDHHAAEPRFGGWEAIRKLSNAVHARGMRLMLDIVLNHVGYDAPLTKQYPDWFHTNGDIEDWSDPKQLVEYDVHGLPDLAVEKEEVYDYLMAHARRWIERANVDGFRLDAVKHLPMDFWRRFNTEIRAFAGDDFVILGEYLDGDPAKLVDVATRGGFDALFDLPLHYALVDVFCRDAPVGRIGAVLKWDRRYPEGYRGATMLDSHDLPRILSACNSEQARVARALDFLFLMRGSPTLTYGTEVGLEGRSEPHNRADMVFDEAHPLRAHVVALARRRAEYPALRSGQTQIVALAEHALALVRGNDEEARVVFLNNGDAPQTLRLPGGATRTVPGRTIEIAPVDFEFSRGGRRTVEVDASGAPLGEQDRLVMVGAGVSLGHWSPVQAPTFERAAGAARLSLSVEDGVLEYKLAILREDEVEWEPGPNRYFFVPSGRGPLALSLTWRPG